MGVLSVHPFGARHTVKISFEHGPIKQIESNCSKPSPNERQQWETSFFFLTKKKKTSFFFNLILGFQSLDSDQKKKARIHSHFICFCGVLLTWRICNCSLIICISFPFHLDSLSPCTPTYSTQSHSVIKIHRFSRKKITSISFLLNFFHYYAFEK